MSDRALDVYVVSHTHWDREWYQLAGRFRQRLVALIDELLDDPPANGASFLLDGQTVVLDDYLDVRPERAAELATLLRDGRLEAGPWFVLGDELIPTGEAIVRNLLAGRRAMRRMRARSPSVLYCPDSFGHPAALPVVAQQFGCPVIVLWRGYGGARWPAGNVAWWSAPDGTRALLYHLERDGYELGRALPVDAAAAEKRWEALRHELAPRAATGIALLPNGADHHARQENIRDALQSLTRVADSDRIHLSTLDRFGQALADAATAQTDTIPHVAGELRDSYGYTWTLQGTFASRAGQKTLVAQVERLLVREAEPWASLARIAGASDRTALLHAAWRTLLLCMPHDTLCGCSTDEVAAAMDTRLDDAFAQVAGIRDDAQLDFASGDGRAARSPEGSAASALVVWNPVPYARSGVALVEIAERLRDAPVGPGSARASTTLSTPSDAGPNEQSLFSRIEHDRLETPLAYPDNDLVQTSARLIWVSDLPGYSFRTVDLDRISSAPNELHVQADDHVLRRRDVKVEAHSDGRIAMHWGDHVVPSLIKFEDEGDAGDLYTPSIIGPVVRSRLLRVDEGLPGPLRASLAAVWRLAVPERIAAPAASTDDEDRLAIGYDTVDHEIYGSIELDAGARALRIRILGENLETDHRIRVVLSTGLSNAAVEADAAFGPVRRTPIEVSASDLEMETPPRTAPLHRYVTLTSGALAVTIVCDGLAEYEAMPNGDVAITLVRAVGELSRANIPERPGHAGWPTPTPDAQSLGLFEATLGIAVHSSQNARVMAERIADEILIPITGRTRRGLGGGVRDSGGGLELRGDGLVFSACKPAEEGDGVVLRCVNVLDQPTHGSWTMPGTTSATLARLDETLGTALRVENGAIEFEAGARAVVTILAR